MTATENLIGPAALARMRPHAFFINLSRGNLVDEAALAAALRENRIAGAAMDVGRARDQMPTPELAKLAECHRDPAYRRVDPAGDRKPVVSKRFARLKRSSMAGFLIGAVNADHWTRRS